MNTILKTLRRKMNQSLERVQQRFQRARPGSILILVVALLVLLALMGTAYVATARLDRVASGPMRDRGLLDETALGVAADIASRYTDRIARDRDLLTHPLGSTDFGTKVQGTTTTWLGSDPMLLVDPTTGGIATVPAPLLPGPTPAWRFISRPVA